MNRNEEYFQLIAELETLPDSIKYAAQRAIARKKSLQKKRRILGIPVGSLAACFLTFMLLVNFFPTFARACGKIPLLRDLAVSVAWSPSLSAAVENDYVQPIDKSQTVNGITATIEYVIVDQKQVNIFLTLQADDYDNLSAELPEFTPEQPCAVLGSNFLEPPGTLLNMTLDYFDEDVPDHLTMTFGVTTYVEPDPAAEDSGQSYEDEMLDPAKPEDPDILAEFTFELDFDPQYTASGRRIPVNQTLTLDGQQITITEAEIYPSHVRINVEDHPDNTAWLKELDFYLENADGQQFSPVSNGISGTGDEDSPMMKSYRLESPYFADDDDLTLVVTGAVWLDKDMETVYLDLEQKRSDSLPEGVSLIQSEKRENGWILTFRAERRSANRVHQIWEMSYLDAAGQEYEITRRSSSTLDDSTFEETLPLSGYQGSQVWLKPVYSRVTTEPVPVEISIR